jgi:DNA-binding CsgD family transcriptional regulator
MLEERASVGEIALALGLARNTIDYHVGRIRTGGRTKPAATLPDLRDTVRQVGTRERVATLLAEGLGRLEIARRLEVSKSTVTYHARRLGHDIDERCARRYDWPAIQRFYDDGHSVTECQAAFGFARETWNSARRRGDVVPRPHAMPLDELLVGRRSRGHLKKRLIKLGLKRDECERCGIVEWRERPLSMALHHVNGDRLDNRLENLRLLCPNCHSQTGNFAGRNGRRAGHSARSV